MAVKHTTQVGSPIIRAKSKPVQDIRSAATKRIVKNLVDSMRHHGLVGMAAPQIGENVRVFVSEIRETTVRKDEGKLQADPVRVFINPKIIHTTKKVVWGFEGCGSVANGDLFGKVKRPQSVTVEATNEAGELFQLSTSGLLARVIQHEMDHIDGVVFTDRADVKTFMSRSEYLQFKNS